MSKRLEFVEHYLNTYVFEDITSKLHDKVDKLT